jgi:hypothetical protein
MQPLYVGPLPAVYQYEFLPDVVLPDGKWSFGIIVDRTVNGMPELSHYDEIGNIQVGE